jgi:hypothetical protein
MKQFFEVRINVFDAMLTKDQPTLNLRLFKNGSEWLETFHGDNGP